MKTTHGSLLIVVLICALLFSACAADSVQSPDNNTEQSTQLTVDTSAPTEDSSETDTIPACQHNVVTDPAVAPTCTKTGLTEGSHCTICSAVIVAQQSVPTIQHSYSEWAIVSSPTCEKQGSQERQCDCGNKQAVAVPVIAHDYVNNVCIMCKKSNAPSFVPDYNAGQANTIGNERSNARYTSQGDWMYFSPSKSQISKLKKSGSDIVTVYNVSSGNVMNINVVGDWVYFYVEGSNASGSYIAKVRTDGVGFEKILSAVTVGDMLVVKDTIFFTTIKSPYTNYAKDCAPLYSISVSGGMPKQIHDGYVSSITADSTYVYFMQCLESGTSTIYRMKHDATKETELMEDVKANYFVLANSKLYFLTADPYSDEYTLASISTNGGNYSTYGKIHFYSEWLHIIGNNAYYGGVPYSTTEFSEKAGIVEYNMSTKQYKVVKEDYEMPLCLYTSNVLIVENYRNQTLTSISLYYPQSKSWKDVSVN